MSLDPQKCAKCPALILWARAAKTGKPMPVDDASVENGNVLLKQEQGGWVAHVLGRSAAAEARALGQPLHLNHFATCPFSRDFRRAK